MGDSSSIPPPERGRQRRPSAAVISAKDADATHRLWSAASQAGVPAHSQYNRTREKTKRARQLRQASTAVEARLWSKLRAGRLDGLEFRRQHPAGAYVLDFYCSQLRLSIE